MSIYGDTVIMICFCILAAVIGAVLGRFLNCAARYIARGESVSKEYSRDSYREHSSGVTEGLFAVLTVLCLLRFDLTVICLRNVIFLCCLFCLALVDMESCIIPDGCLITSAAAWIASIPFVFGEYGGWSGILSSLLAAVVYGGGLLVLTLLVDYMLKKKSLGGGDIKLFAVVGLYLGPVESLFALLLACILGLLCVVICGKREGKFAAAIPFGPAIAAASWIMLMYGSYLIDW